MKKIVLLALSVVWTFVVHGQDTTGYRSFFGQESTMWNCVSADIDSEPWNHLLRVGGDTIIGDKLYKRIEYSFVLWEYGYDEDRDSTYDFYLREEPVGGKLWCRLHNRDSEFLIADMTLSVGDSFYFYDRIHGRDSVLRVVRRIDTIDSRKKIVFSDRLCFVEGVGCTNLIDYSGIYSYSDYFYYSEIICCHHDNNLIYHFSWWNPELDVDCVIHEVGIDAPEALSAFRLYPNPCRDWIKVDGEGIKSMRIYNAQGLLEKSETNNSGIINVSDLPAGVYVLRIFSRDSIIDKKIIKQ